MVKAFCTTILSLWVISWQNVPVYHWASSMGRHVVCANWGDIHILNEDQHTCLKSTRSILQTENVSFMVSTWHYNKAVKKRIHSCISCYLMTIVFSFFFSFFTAQVLPCYATVSTVVPSRNI